MAISGFFLNVVSFFAILLPGAALGLLVLGPVRTFILRGETTAIAFGTQDWLIFLAVSYLLGQGLFAVGSWLLDHLYDCSYRVYERIKKGTALEDYVRSLVPTAGQAGPQLTTTYPWARAYVAVRSAEAIADVDRLEADSKFFRSFTLVFLLGPLFFLDRPIGWLIAVAALLAIGSAVKEFDDLNSRHEPRHPGPWPRPLAIFAAILYLMGLLIILGLGSRELLPTHFGAISTVVYIVGVVGAFLRFATQRWQRNETLYEFLVALERKG